MSSRLLILGWIHAHSNLQIAILLAIYLEQGSYMVFKIVHEFVCAPMYSLETIFCVKYAYFRSIFVQKTVNKQHLINMNTLLANNEPHVKFDFWPRSHDQDKRELCLNFLVAGNWTLSSPVIVGFLHFIWRFTLIIKRTCRIETHLSSSECQRHCATA